MTKPIHHEIFTEEDYAKIVQNQNDLEKLKDFLVRAQAAGINVADKWNRVEQAQQMNHGIMTHLMEHLHPKS